MSGPDLPPDRRHPATTVSSGPLIALISAVPAAIEPIRAAMEEQLPSARVWNIVDDRLLADATDRGGLTSGLEQRMRRLIDHAMLEGADGIVLTCSLYGPVAGRYAPLAAVPVVGPDDAVIAAATGGTYRHVLVVSSGTEPLADSVHRTRRAATAGVRISGAVAHGSAAAARAGDHRSLVSSITAAVAAADPSVDVVVLGQYSLASAADDVADATGVPTLTGPGFAVATLRHLLEGNQP